MFAPVTQLAAAYSLAPTPVRHAKTAGVPFAAPDLAGWRHAAAALIEVAIPGEE
jgi:hypothetical protein